MRYVFPWDTTEKGLCSENHPVEETARSGRRFERDAIALAFERVNGSMADPLGTSAIGVVGAGVLVGDLACQKVVRRHEEGGPGRSGSRWPGCRRRSVRGRR